MSNSDGLLVGVMLLSDLVKKGFLKSEFFLKRQNLFLKQSTDEGLSALKGHRSVGGIRASIYNAVAEASVDALIEFMAEFERTHG